ncbi:hypothetical protein [Companilactobacillus mishanensis]|uniref:Uncharacterized protein n=1 Tax=Companilactobacillus mishanensis TaxID=2486008 RepID=A0A5P0ZF63_9LACO|nr:hypothetical protein [Companilactobacillus mishanensis]MQS44268.1 hypothetical protein [Companilactobacillus mishanensis]MQS51629.1 hypothetical protein [Companilactobacillus mishanensis]
MNDFLIISNHLSEIVRSDCDRWNEYTQRLHFYRSPLYDPYINDDDYQDIDEMRNEVEKELDFLERSFKWYEKEKDKHDGGMYSWFYEEKYNDIRENKIKVRSEIQFYDDTTNY